MDNSADNDIVAAAIHMAIQGPRRGRDAVDALISRLSPWELLYLRSRARGIQVDATQANGFATCANLPADILRLIVEYLSPHDLPSFRRVSRGWKRVWMQPDILRVVFRQHFPGLLEFHPEDQDLERLFLDTMSRYQCKSQQECYSTVVPWDINVTLRSHPADGRSILPLPTNSLRRSMHYPGPHSLYYNGRVVWQPALGQIVVDDLRSGHRARYAAGVDPRRRRSEGKLAALTDTLVVLASCRSPSGAVSSSPRFL